MFMNYILSLIKYEKFRVRVHLIEETDNDRMFGSIHVVHPGLLTLIGYSASNIEISTETHVLKDPYRRN